VIRAILRDGDAAGADLARIRAELEKRREHAAEIAGAPLPDAEVEAAIRAHIARGVDALREVSNPGALRLPGGMEELRVLPAAGSAGDVSSLLRLALLQLPAVASILLDEASRANPAKAGLPAAERAARLSKLSREIAAFEEQEEHEALKLEARGYIVPRREDVDVALLVRLWSEPPLAAEAR
jgi:hypothetical protein